MNWLHSGVKHPGVPSASDASEKARRPPVVTHLGVYAKNPSLKHAVGNLIEFAEKSAALQHTSRTFVSLRFTSQVMTSALSLAAAEKLTVKLKACGGKLCSNEF